ncbi:MAG: ATP-binding protein [Candidatus Diapherotrites archaeon]
MVYMKFYDREQELREMKLLKKKQPSMLVITGRRRVGKTEIIKRFLAKEKGIYFFVDNQKSEKMLLREYSKQLLEYFNLKEYISIDSWEKFLELIFDLAKKKDTTIAFDEFQRFLQINPSFINQLQKYWDVHRNKIKLFLVLSGSSIGMMRKIFIEQKAPLFKRAQNILFVEIFDFKTIYSILNDLGVTSFKTKLEIYSFFGGVIYYYTLLDYYNVKNTDDLLEKLILRKNAPLKNEVRDIVIESFGKEHKTYYSILTAVALGKTTKKEICDFVDVKETSLSHYLYDLMNILNVVNYDVPVTEEKPWRSKKGHYFLKDNFFKFWFKFIFRNMSYYEIGNYDYILEKIKIELNSFVGKNFEEVCKEFLVELNKQKKLPFVFSKIGNWLDRKGNEIDLVALSDRHEILFAECKWQDKKVGLKELFRLKEKAKQVQWHGKYRKEYFALFSKAGFERNCLSYCKKNKVMAFDLKHLNKVFS